MKKIRRRMRCPRCKSLKTVKNGKRINKGEIAIKRKYKPEWSGYINIDDKYIRYSGKKILMLVATDKSGDIVHSELLEVEEQQRFDEFFKFIRDRLGYKFRGKTTDLDEMLEKSIVRELSKEIPHQKCIKHALDNIAKIVGLSQKKRRLQKTEQEAKILPEEYKRANYEYSEA